ncbi:MAG TPA: cation:proton antiporter [Candidatus Binatia bacterium]|nr:cation:proton antiporter [Candidatus Binatia bacterium]
MHFDPLMLQLVGALLVMLAMALVMRLLRQPSVVGYIVAGLLLGPSGFDFFHEYQLVVRMGDLGVMLLLFFVGMETSPRRLLQRWRVTLLGIVVQIAGSLLLMSLLAWWLGWPPARAVLMAFVISLSSTAVVLNYLRDTGQMQSRLGRDALGILIAQDVLLVPMLLVVNWIAGGRPHPGELALQGIGALLALGLLAWMTLGGVVKLPWARRLRADRELQVFVAFGLCLGFALLFAYFRLSSALGAFLAGMLIGVARETNWVHHRLEPFRTVFVALFFVSVGLLVSVPFVRENWLLVGVVTLGVFLCNTGVNAVIFRMLGDGWRYSLFAGAHLAQVGEFSFVLAAAGARESMISDVTYQLVVAVIALSLALSPGWIAAVGWVQRGKEQAPRG